jgi:16S rRNA (uracil1498-N3)-methyltransferase
MRLHRFYIDPEVHELDHDFWLSDDGLFNQLVKVFRYRTGSEIILFDGVAHERLYRITDVGRDAVHVTMVTDFERTLPHRHIYLFWALLKKDNNEWILQKATELGVSNFVPVLAERSEKTGFNLERAQRILIEAAEQCGRSDIPRVREPIGLDAVVQEYAHDVTLLVCDEREKTKTMVKADKPVGILIGPEGGWSPDELAAFTSAGVGSLHLGRLTLRAETAAVVAAAQLLR